LLKQFFRDFGAVYAGNALVGFIFAATGPVAIVLAVGMQGGLSQADLASWIFGSFFVNGLISIAFCLHYRQPLVFFWTIPGTVLVGPALGHLSFPEVIGAFIATGVLMLALGLSGWVKRCTEAAPMPIVMAMVAGVFLRFGVGLVYSVRDDFWIAAPMILAFLFLSWSSIGKRLPPVLGAMGIGVLMMFFLQNFDLKGQEILKLTLPNSYAPAFSWQAMIELVVPLAITVLVVQNGQGFAVLTAAGHKPPMNAIAAACGAGSIAAAFTGTVSSCLTGPVNAIISANGEKHRHYAAGVFVGALAVLFGLMSTSFTRLLLATPPAFIAALGGLAMLRVLQTAFTTAFGSGRFALGALVTFLVTVADVPIFNVGAAFWGLVLGFAVSWLLERKDFETTKDPARRSA
jgi:benzoate membrane transport protein